MKNKTATPLGITYYDLQAMSPVESGLEPRLANAAGHSLMGAGSLNRAKLATETALSLGMPAEHAKQIGTSIEFFHLASLILDDLPCMDDATMRRSQQCTHVLYGESSAILAALGFINRAYFLMWQVFSEFPARARMDAARLADQCLGMRGVLNGQAHDLAFEPQSNGAEHVLEIARLKTGSLLRLCLLLPALLLESDRDVKLGLARLSDLWGTAYQVADDLKDIFCGSQVSGKTACRDAQLGRPNIVHAIGAENAMELLEGLLSGAADEISKLSAEQPGLAVVLTGFQKRLLHASTELAKAHVAA